MSVAYMGTFIETEVVFDSLLYERSSTIFNVVILVNFYLKSLVTLVRVHKINANLVNNFYLGEL